MPFRYISSEDGEDYEDEEEEDDEDADADGDDDAEEDANGKDGTSKPQYTMRAN